MSNFKTSVIHDAEGYLPRCFHWRAGNGIGGQPIVASAFVFSLMLSHAAYSAEPESSPPGDLDSEASRTTRLVGVVRSECDASDVAVVEPSPRTMSAPDPSDGCAHCSTEEPNPLAPLLVWGIVVVAIGRRRRNKARLPARIGSPKPAPTADPGSPSPAAGLAPPSGSTNANAGAS